MAPLSAAPEERNLQLRVLSAIVILAFALVAVWLGGWAFAVLIAVIGGAMCWEWAKLSAPGLGYVRWIMVATMVVAPGFFVGLGVYWAVGLLAVGWTLMAAVATKQDAPNRAILLAGLPYIGIGMLAALWLRTMPAAGLVTFVWLIAVVIATDIGAYFVGRGVGGPRLAPRISPKKTWSGLAGGGACAGLASLIVAFLYPQTSAVALVAAGVVLALVAQCGDLLESAMKRHLQVKDASNLIPGHGGFLDRFDGYLTVMPVAALMTWAREGSPLAW